MIQISEKTRFRWLASPEYAASRDIWDHEIAVTKSFVAVPSLGALVAGWILIVPKRPMLSLRELDPRERIELLNLHQYLASVLGSRGHSVYAFEHGSASVGSATGCGVDQAHLHLVPLKFDLLDAATSETGSGIRWHPTRGIPLTKLPLRGEYISVWRVGDDTGVLGAVRKPVSQWIRRVIARQLGIEEEWNYRTNPQIENIRMTVEMFHRSAQSTR